MQGWRAKHKQCGNTFSDRVGLRSTFRKLAQASSRMKVARTPLHGMQRPAAQQLEVGSAVHVAFEQLEPRNLPLDLSLAPGQGESSRHGRSISPELFGQSLKRCNAAALGAL